SDVADPHGHAEVVTQPVLKNQAAGHGVEGGEEENGGFGDGVKDKVEEHEENDRQDNRQPFFCAYLEFVFAGPLVGVTGGELEFLAEQPVRLGYKSAVVPGGEVEIDVSGEKAVLVANHRRTAGEIDRSHLRDRNLRSRRRRDQDPAQLLHVVAEVAAVAHIDRITLATFDIFGDVLAANAGSDRALHIGDRQTVAGGFGAVDFDIDVEALGHALRKDGAEFCKFAKNLLKPGAGALNPFDGWTLNLQADGSLDARELHVEPVLHGHRPGIREARELKFFVELADQFLIGHAR